MILTLTINPAIDVTYTIDTLTPGESHRVHDVSQRAGGKGVNVARVLHEQGRDALVVAPIGGAAGHTFARDLDDAGISHHLIEVSSETRRTLAVVDGTCTTNLNEAGAALTAAELTRLLDQLQQDMVEATVLVCSGSIPPETDPDLMHRVVALGRTAGVPVIIDTSGPHLLAAAHAGADLLKPNRSELFTVLDRPDAGDDSRGDTGDAALADAIAAGRELAIISNGMVVVSLGAQGMIAVRSQGPAVHASIPNALSGNTTGAGDAAVAALAAGYAECRDSAENTIPEIAALLQRATAWSAAAVLAPLAGSITDPAAIADRVHVRELPAPPKGHS